MGFYFYEATLFALLCSGIRSAVIIFSAHANEHLFTSCLLRLLCRGCVSIYSHNILKH